MSEEAVLRRIRIRSVAVAGLSGVGAFLFGWESGVSLTICAAAVILSFLVFEKLTERLVPQQVKPGIRTLLPLLLVTAASIVLLGVVLFRWRGFNPLAGAVGLSAVVVAIIPEVWQRKA